MSSHLHIVAFDVPYPADYGGVSDIFYKIKGLYKIGIKIHLHCFEYRRGKAAELNQYCEQVNYYPRKLGLKGFSFNLPYIVTSRANKSLLQNLLQDDHPVLLEGIHCTYFLFTDQLKNKKVFVRLHNVEFEYYRQLAKSESSFYKKVYYIVESILLKNYENNLGEKAMLLAITSKDLRFYRQNYHSKNIKYLPAFVEQENVYIKEGKGDYCLYQANLSIAENEKAAKWLIKEVFPTLTTILIIAGKNPSKALRNAVVNNKNITLVANPSQDELNELISNAQVNILPSFSSSGIKIKLLNAIFKGRHCLVNKRMIDGTELGPFCHVAESGQEFKAAVMQLFDESFTRNEIEQRNNLLRTEFNNSENAMRLMQWIQ